MSYTPPPPPPPGAGGYAAPQTNQKALWSMILGILSIVCCGLFAGIPAIILGGKAKNEIGASGGAQTGDGMAKAGVILGWISIAFSVLSLIFVLTTGALSGAGSM
jgi:Domain of unknown function (DUF4190)